MGYQAGQRTHSHGQRPDGRANARSCPLILQLQIAETEGAAACCKADASRPCHQRSCTWPRTFRRGCLRSTMPRLIRGMGASGSNVTVLRPVAGEPTVGRSVGGVPQTGGTGAVRRTRDTRRPSTETEIHSDRRAHRGGSVGTAQRRSCGLRRLETWVECRRIISEYPSLQSSVANPLKKRAENDGVTPACFVRTQ